MKCPTCKKIGYYACVEDRIHKITDNEYKQVVIYECLCGEVKKVETAIKI